MRYNEYTPAGFDIEKMEYDARKASTGSPVGAVRYTARDGLDDIEVEVCFDRHGEFYAYRVDGVPTPRDQVSAILVNTRA